MLVWCDNADGGAGYVPAVDAAGETIHAEVCDELKSEASLEAWVLLAVELAQDAVDEAELLSGLHAINTRLERMRQNLGDADPPAGADSLR